MRPLKLSFYGLNSFKEEQEIDFSALGAGNVFGIFGPTGSGKSTIIDAITLALYGKVERAPDKIRGIVNKSMTEAMARFDFSIGVGALARVYRVERKYVSKDDSISCRLARISEITPTGNKVLADKVSHVDEQVVDILGLTVDDFTRAVVLPQGKFAEFLGLKGKERREMLERIFNLTCYGEKLLSVANNRAKEVEAQVMTIQGEQQGLGNASREVLVSAEEDVVAAEAIFASALEALIASNKAWSEAKEVRELQEKIELGMERKAALDASSVRLAELQARMDHLAAADVVWPHAVALDDATETQRAAFERQSAGVQVLEGAEALLASSRVALSAAKAARQDEEPRILLRQHDLKRAIALSEERQGLQAAVTTERALYGEAVTRLEAAKQELTAILQREKKSQETEVALRQELAGTVVLPEERHALEEATRHEITWLTLERQLAERRTEEQSRRGSLDTAKGTLNQARESVTTLKLEHTAANMELDDLMSRHLPEVGAGEQELQNSYRLSLQDLKYKSDQAARIVVKQESLRHKRNEAEKQLCATQDKASRLEDRLASLRALLAENEAKYKAAKEACLIGELAAQVSPGEKCPVCGSRSHPELGSRLPPPNLEHFAAAITESTTLWQKAIAEQAAIVASAEVVSSGLAALQHQDEELAVEGKAVAEEIVKVKGAFPAVWNALSLADIEQNVLLLAKDMELRAERRQLWQCALDKGRQAERVLADKLARSREAHAVAEQHVASLEAEFNYLVAKVMAVASDEAQATAILQECLLQHQITDLKLQKELLQNKDRKQKELNDTMKQLETKLSELQMARQAAEKVVTIAQDAVSALLFKVQGLQERESKLAQEVQSLVGDADPSVESLVAEASLRALREEERQCEEKHVRVLGVVEQAKNELSSGTEALRIADFALDKARGQFAAAMQNSPFASRLALQQAREGASFREAWADEISRYHEQQMLLASDLASWHKSLSGRALSAIAWQTIETTYLEAELARDEAMRQLGQAEAKLGDIKARHARYVALAQRLQVHTKERDLMAELVTLLRGNALVEFMAGEHLHTVTAAATEWLRTLSSHRYALEVDPEGGFLIRDDGQGGMKRPVHTLSGGETFITSLALALALSMQIQLRGRFPLEFFFLDEGFGTLDSELLETVMCCLERMQGQNLSIGIISHVRELVERIPRKIIVTPAQLGGRGSLVSII